MRKCACPHAHTHCKEALASRGCLKRKVPAGFIADWAVVTRRGARVGVELNHFDFRNYFCGQFGGQESHEESARMTQDDTNMADLEGG